MTNDRAKYYGLNGNGSFDNLERLTACLEDWASEPYPGDLTIPPGRYLVSDTINITPQGTRIGGRLTGYGAHILCDTGVDYGFTLDASARTAAIWRNLTIEGFQFQDGGMKCVNVMSAPGVTKYTYMLTLRDIACEEFDEHGISLSGSWETQVYSPRLSAASSNTTGDCISITDDDLDPVVQKPSSIDIFAPTTRFGRHGISADTVDVSVFGGTFLFADVEAVNLLNTWFELAGLHVEGACAGEVATYGMKLTGAGTVSNPRFVRNPTGSSMVDGILAYANQHIVVIGSKPEDANMTGDTVVADGADSAATVTVVGVSSSRVRAGRPATLVDASA